MVRKTLIFPIKGTIETISRVALPWATKRKENVQTSSCFGVVARFFLIDRFRFQNIMQVAYRPENEPAFLVLWLENYELLPADDECPRQNWSGDRNALVKKPKNDASTMPNKSNTLLHMLRWINKKWFHFLWHLLQIKY